MAAHSACPRRVLGCLAALLIPFGSSYALPGDVNGSGVLDPGDFLALVDHLVIRTPLQGDALARGDTNGDGHVDVADLVALVRGGIQATVPGAPTLNPLASPTNKTTVIATGTAAPNASVRLTGGATTTQATANAQGAFSVSVSLTPNRLNRLYASVPGQGGLVSPTAAVEIIQDQQKPALFIDAPLDGEQFTVDTVDVAGRVADLLSGFAGLSVTVNGQKADVNIGIGTNGSYLRSSVPLSPGANTLAVVATDGAGNQTTKQVTVTRVTPTGPRLTVVSGNQQTGEARMRLANPVVVQVTDGNGAVVPNQQVLFTVVRSDGLLFPAANAPDPGSRTLTVTTASDGTAQAWWRMGGDAGHGNDRLKVTGPGIQGAVFFCASANPMPASQINVGSGNNQRVETGGRAYEPLKAWISDGCNGVGGIPVTFTVVQGLADLNGVADQKTVTVNTLESGHAEVVATAGPFGGHIVVEANFPGNPGAAAAFTILAVERDISRPTTFEGVVQDNASCPIGGAQCTLIVDGAGALNTFSDPQGHFSFAGIPAGHANLYVDGLTATTLGGRTIPNGSYPSLHYEVVIIPNATNSIGMPVLLPPLNPKNARMYDGSKDVVLTCEGMTGLKMTIKAGSMRRPDGSIPSPSDPAVVSLNQVHHDSVPMPMPDGAAPPFAWTLQPGGATFNPPVQIEYPNMTGLPPGAVSNFLSFNHDTGRFEIVASGTVSEDGLKITTDAGAGISTAGWGCNCPPYSSTGDCHSECKGVTAALFAGGVEIEEWVATLLFMDFRQALNDLAGNLRDLDPDQVFAFVVNPRADGDIQLSEGKVRIDAIRRYRNRKGCSDPQVVLVGHSLGGDTVRLSGSIDAVMRFAQDPISRELIINPPFLCLAYQRNQTFSAPSHTTNYLSVDLPSDVATACQVPDCHSDALIRCLRGYQIAGAGNTVIAGSDHNNIAALSSPLIIDAVKGLLGKSGRGRAKTNPPGVYLDSSFTLMANGQPYEVGDDGFFSIENITAPDNFGPGGPGTPPDYVGDDFVRVTGVGKRNGQTWYAFSDPFQIRQGEDTIIHHLNFTQTPPPLPVSITAVPSKPTITQLGGTSQVHTTATLADGSTVDVTPNAAWTSYRISNPDIATINEDGLVKGLRPGAVYVTAINNAATSVCLVTVSAGDPLTTIRGRALLPNSQGADQTQVKVIGAAGQATAGSDGTFSISGVATQAGPLGLTLIRIGAQESYFAVVKHVLPQPGQTTDAGDVTLHSLHEIRGQSSVDSDGDGLDDAYESTVTFTDPHKADTTGDGVVDGLEDSDGDGLPSVIELLLGTNPGNADTDGDGLSDGEELRYGSDPNVADTDHDGLTDAEEVILYHTDPLTPDSTPPTISLTFPTQAKPLVRGDHIVIQVSARDDGRVTQVEYFVNGASVGASTTVPFSFAYTVPANATSITIEAKATDTNGNGGTTGPIAFGVIADPLTIVMGRVLDPNGQPVQSAKAAVGPGFETTSGSDGRFNIANVPTVNGSIVVTISFQGAAGPEWGRSAPKPPVRGGTTNAGDIRLRPGVQPLFDGLRFPTGMQPESVAVADFNGDGVPDVVAVNANPGLSATSDSLSLLFGYGDGTLLPQLVFDIGSGFPVAVLALDITGDRTPDIVLLRHVGTQDYPTVAVYPGHGDGTFGNAINSPLTALGGALCFALTDVDGDGKLDAVVGAVNGQMGVAFGNGNGVFGSPALYTIQGDIEQIAAGDLDNNGKADIVVTVPSQGKVEWFLNNGDGTLAAPLTVALGSHPTGLAVADLNRDNNLDLVVALRHSANKVSVLIGRGDGTFAAGKTYDTGPVTDPLALVVDDLNDDGDLDVAAANNRQGSVSILLGSGDGSLQPAVQYSCGAGAFALAVADMDGDGRRDIVTANDTSNDLSVLLNKGNGIFPSLPPGYTLGSAAFFADITTADFNGDGKLDVAGPGNARNLGALLGIGDGSFQTAKQSPVSSSSVGAVRSGRFNNDSVPDLVYLGTYPATSFNVLPGNGDGTFHAENFTGIANTPLDFALGDFNGDAYTDVVWMDNQSFTVLLCDGAGHLNVRPAVTGFTLGLALAVGDVNGDAKADVLVATRGNTGTGGTLFVFEGDGSGGFAAPVQATLPGTFPASDLVLADLNGDGKRDLVVLTSEGFSGNLGFRIMLGHGDGTFTAGAFYAANADAKQLVVTDIDQDGHPDVVSLGRASNDISIFLGRGDGSFGEEQRYNTGQGTYSVAAGDVNGDGQPDLLVGNSNDNAVHVFLQRP